MTTIVEIGEIAWQGKTRPVFCKGDDGFEYVVKGNYAGRKALISEWVAGRLGQLVGLPIPPLAILEADQALLRYGANREAIALLGCGPFFGSRRVSNVIEIRAGDIDRISPKLQARVLAFDWWVANSDRVLVEGAGNPNLLWVENAQELIVIDHNLAFEPELMDAIWKEHIFRSARHQWTSAFREEMERLFRAAMALFPKIWSELPVEWTEEAAGPGRVEAEALLWKFQSSSDTFWGYR